MKKVALFLLCIFCIVITAGAESGGQMKYVMPGEDTMHEGTWLTWPHEYTYGKKYRDEIENIWVAMTKALTPGEMVHIIAYDEKEKNRIIGLLRDNKTDLKKVDFVIAKSDDVWVRDTGPLFVYDEKGTLVIADFGFDGWGKAPYKNDDKIPKEAARTRDIPMVEIPEFILEGGAIEIDGHGTLMATLSCVNSNSRNRNLDLLQVEQYLKQYLGVWNFIWLEGVEGEDITDAHIDGIARFVDKNTLLTVSKHDFFELYEGIKAGDYKILTNAKNADGRIYDIVEIPLTASNVKGLDYKGTYLNYYIGNDVVLIPVYNDINDEKAVKIISSLYPNKKTVPINVSKLYKNGGMIHCITQQQPAEKEL